MLKDLNLIFILGAPRSGTTWIQDLLVSHSGIQSGQETEIFSYYIRQLFSMWHQQNEIDSKSSRGLMGLPVYMDRKRFIEHIRTFTDSIYKDLIADGKIFVDKTPSHILVIDIINEIYPGSKFLHIIRDGRDVVASLIAASKGWGSDWAPSSIKEACKLWISYVESGIKYLENIPDERKLIIKYEDVLEDTFKYLNMIFKWIGIELSVNECSRIIEENSFIKKNKNRQRKYKPFGKEPEGFYRKGKINSWMQDFNNSEQKELTSILGPHLEALGYNI